MLLHPNQSPEYYTKAIDQWSLGILAYELLVGKPPFEMKDQEQTKVKIAGYKGRVKDVVFPRYVSSQAKDFMKRLLDKDPEKRMGLGEVGRHPWIVKHVGKSFQARLSGVL